MEQKQKDALWAQYTKQTHRLGRVLSLITVALLLGAPFVIGALLGAYPDLGATARGFLSVGLVWTVSSVAEFLIYTPMLGAGGGYLAFITGNLINMKIPCAVNARDLAGVRTGTPENEIVSTLSIATASLVKSVADGRIDPEKIVMLNITGGGEHRCQQDKELWYLEPSLVFPLTPDPEEVVAKTEALFD